MRCVACGAEMILVKVVQLQDDAPASSGVEDHSFICSQCHKFERRLIRTRYGREVDTAPPIVPASATHSEHIATLLRRVLAKIRGSIGNDFSSGER
jgi:hypothetical protein